MKSNKILFLVIFVILSVFTVTACSDNKKGASESGSTIVDGIKPPVEDGNNETETPEPEPEPVPEPEPEPEIITLKMFTGGSNSKFVILSDGSIYSWGDNSFGQLGLGDEETEKTAPTLFNFSSDIKQLISYNNNSTFAIMNNGSLYS